jgi:hypothetical protein
VTLQKPRLHLLVAPPLVQNLPLLTLIAHRLALGLLCLLALGRPLLSLDLCLLAKDVGLLILDLLLLLSHQGGWWETIYPCELLHCSNRPYSKKRNLINHIWQKVNHAPRFIAPSMLGIGTWGALAL